MGIIPLHNLLCLFRIYGQQEVSAPFIYLLFGTRKVPKKRKGEEAEEEEREREKEDESEGTREEK